MLVVYHYFFVGTFLTHIFFLIHRPDRQLHTWSDVDYYVLNNQVSNCNKNICKIFANDYILHVIHVCGAVANIPSNYVPKHTLCVLLIPKMHWYRVLFYLNCGVVVNLDSNTLERKISDKIGNIHIIKPTTDTPLELNSWISMISKQFNEFSLMYMTIKCGCDSGCSLGGKYSRWHGSPPNDVAQGY